MDSQHSISHVHETNITQLLNDLREHNLGTGNHHNNVGGPLSIETSFKAIHGHSILRNNYIV